MIALNTDHIPWFHNLKFLYVDHNNYKSQFFFKGLQSVVQIYEMKYVLSYHNFSIILKVVF